ncbi:MAG: type II secretion system protein GspL [Xylophilus ampelinus]
MSTLIVSLPLTFAPPAASPAPDDGQSALSATDSLAYGYVLTADGQAPQQHGAAPLALLPQPSRPAGEVVALVPAQALSWHRVQLPRGALAQPARLRAVLDGLLEDRLLDDPQGLHLALQPGAGRAAGPVWVAACDRAWLRAGLQALEAAGRPVARIVPEFAPPADPASADGGADDAPAAPPPPLQVIGTPDEPLLVAAGARPVADGAVAVLPFTLETLALLQSAADADADAPVLVEPPVAAQAEALLGRPVALQTAAQRWTDAARGPWDLAQFDLARSGRRRAAKKAGTLAGELLRAPQWRPLRWGVALFAAVQLVGVNAQAWKERTALDAQQARIRSLLTSTFPTVPLVVDAPLQMEREVAALRQAAGAPSGRDLEVVLSALGGAAPAGRSAASIDLASETLRVGGLDLTSEEAAAVAARFASAGLQAAEEGGQLVLRPEAAR